MAKPLYTAYAINPSTGEAVRYTGTRQVTCATFGRGYRDFKNRFTGRSYVKEWTITEAPEGQDWRHVGWSTQDFLKAQKAARGTNPYIAEVMAVEVVDLDKVHAEALELNEDWGVCNAVEAAPGPVFSVGGFEVDEEDPQVVSGFEISATPQIEEGDTVTMRADTPGREWLVTYVEPGTGLVCLETTGEGVTVRPAAKHVSILTLVRKGH